MSRYSPWPRRLFEKATVQANGCWVMTRSLNKRGYATVRGERGTGLAHRLAYEATVGPIPDGLEIDHLCMNPPCINPQHLEPVTRDENMRRRFARQTHCKRGHEFTPENTRRDARGHRQCFTCKRANEMAYYYASRGRQQVAS